MKATIVETPGRIQPFSVWSQDGQIICFTATREEAEKAKRKWEKHREVVGR